MCFVKLGLSVVRAGRLRDIDLVLLSTSASAKADAPEGLAAGFWVVETGRERGRAVCSGLMAVGCELRKLYLRKKAQQGERADEASRDDRGEGGSVWVERTGARPTDRPTARRDRGLNIHNSSASSNSI